MDHGNGVFAPFCPSFETGTFFLYIYMSLLFPSPLTGYCRRRGYGMKLRVVQVLIEKSLGCFIHATYLRPFVMQCDVPYHVKGARLQSQDKVPIALDVLLSCKKT
jgi:hypothetical protein